MGWFEVRGLRMAAALLLLAGGCGGKGGGPTTPPAPITTPAATPTPEPPLSASCERLPLGSATYVCRDQPAEFLHPVLEAIATLRQEHPEIFDGNKIRNAGLYYVGLIRILDRSSLCAAFDGAELAVKNSNEFSEQYRIQTSWGEVRTTNTYMGACFPAVFPLARGGSIPAPAGCPLPPSSEAACDRVDPQFLGDVEAAIDTVLQQHPELFDFSQTKGDWPLVRDLGRYQSAVVDALLGRGFCARFDGEEIQMKRSNDFTEHYDVNYQDRYVRRGPGAYRGTCYPAAF